MRLSIFNRHPRAEFSAYLDGELIPLRIEAMQAHLTSCQSCRAELEALRELSAGLATLEETAAPRSFALTPEMIARPLREPAVVPARARAMANGMRLAGAGMTLALVLVLVLDFTGGGTKGGGGSTAANVQQFGAAQNSDASAPQAGVAPAPTPALPQSDLAGGPAPALPGGTTQSGGLSSGSGPSAGPEAPGFAPAPVAGAPTPIVQKDEPTSVDKSLPGIAQASPANAPAAFNAQPSIFDAQQPAAASTGSDGGVDVLLIIAVALAAGVILAVAASFVLPRLGQEDV